MRIVLQLMRGWRQCSAASSTLGEDPKLAAPLYHPLTPRVRAHSANLNLIGGKKASFYQLDGTTQTAVRLEPPTTHHPPPHVLGLTPALFPPLSQCGETKYSADWIVALGDDLFSQDKCGKSITLMNYDTGIEKTATISDRCEICASAGRIDLA